MVTDHLMDIMSSEANLSINQSVTIDPLLNSDGDSDGDGDDEGTCKQALRLKDSTFNF